MILKNKFFIYLIVALPVIACTVFAEDWPTYQHDNRRSGITKEQLPKQLKKAWVYNSPALPQKAWAGAAKWDAYAEVTPLKSMRNFDPVFYVTAVGDSLYFGSSADDSVHCLNAETGKINWSFPADGPVRMPPSLHNGNAYFGSDDGFAYCLNAKDGSFVWKYKPSQQLRLIPSNGKMISLLPCRTGVMIHDKKAYCAYSLLPWEQSFLCALNTDIGSEIYKAALNEITMQGAILASDEQLYVPQGRSAPLVFNRADGKKLGTVTGGGGTYALLTEDSHLIHGPGNKAGWLAENKNDHIITFDGASRMIVTTDKAYLHRPNELSAFDRLKYLQLQAKKPQLANEIAEKEKKIKELTEAADTEKTEELTKNLAALKDLLEILNTEINDCFIWKKQCPPLHTIIMAGDTLFTGSNGRVLAYSTANGEELWSATVTGNAHGLAVANGRLFVSTDRGMIYCFIRNEN